MKLTAIINLAVMLLPLAAEAGLMTSYGYIINGARIVSGGSRAHGDSGMSNTGIDIGQTVYIPVSGSDSPASSIAVAVLARLQPGVIHNGDINGDGAVDITDALLALKAGIGLVQLSSVEVVRGDVNPLVNFVPVGDGKIDIKDAFLILRKSVALGW